MLTIYTRLNLYIGNLKTELKWVKTKADRNSQHKIIPFQK